MLDTGIARLFLARNVTAGGDGQPTAQFITERNNNGTANRRCVSARSVAAALRRKRGLSAASTVLGLTVRTQARIVTAGRVLLHFTLLTYGGAFLSPQWVCRVHDVSGNTAGSRTTDWLHELKIHEAGPNSSAFDLKTLYCFGVWIACDDRGRCDDVWNIVPGVGQRMVRVIQVQATVVLLGYSLAALLDLASRLTLCVCLAFNRGVEAVLSFCAVLHFLTLLYQTGEVKNNAAKVHGLRDSAAWGFLLSLCSLATAVLATCVLGLFRLTPPAYKHRRFWKVPAELKPRAYLAHAYQSGAEGRGLSLKALAALPPHLLPQPPNTAQGEEDSAAARKKLPESAE